MTDITNQIPVSEIKASIETRFDNYHKPKNEKADFAVDLLKRYSKQTGNLLRGTSDLSPLEEWLIIQLIEAQKEKDGAFRNNDQISPNGFRRSINNKKDTDVSNIYNGGKGNFDVMYPACNLIGESGRNLISPIDQL